MFNSIINNDFEEELFTYMNDEDCSCYSLHESEKDRRRMHRKKKKAMKKNLSLFKRNQTVIQNYSIFEICDFEEIIDRDGHQIMYTPDGDKIIYRDGYTRPINCLRRKDKKMCRRALHKANRNRIKRDIIKNNEDLCTYSHGDYYKGVLKWTKFADVDIALT